MKLSRSKLDLLLDAHRMIWSFPKHLCHGITICVRDTSLTLAVSNSFRLLIRGQVEATFLILVRPLAPAFNQRHSHLPSTIIHLLNIPSFLDNHTSPSEPRLFSLTIEQAKSHCFHITSHLSPTLAIIANLDYVDHTKSQKLHPPREAG